MQQKGKNYIVCLCLAESKMYVYTATGILVGRVLYRDVTKECGKPCSISENGKYMLFRKSDTDP